MTCAHTSVLPHLHADRRFKPALRSALEGIRAVELAENLPPSQRLEPMPFDYSRASARRVWLFDPTPRMGRPPLILRWSWRWEGGTPA